MSWTSPETINASAGIGSFLNYLSEITNFWFGRMIAIAIFIIFFAGYLKAKSDDFIGGFAVASYVTFVLGLIMWVLGILSNYDMGIIVSVTAISSLILFLQKKDT